MMKIIILIIIVVLEAIVIVIVIIIENKDQQHKPSNMNPLGPQGRPVKFRKKMLQNICVFSTKVVRDALGLERKRSDNDYSL